MSAKKRTKTIATINFKGGVGKTTVTWCLGDLISTFGKSNVLLFDLDAQMSLTQAITLNEGGDLHGKFGDWQERSKKRGKTIFRAIEEYTKGGDHTKGSSFNFSIDYDFIYQITGRYHFVPSCEDLYWLELDMFDQARMQTFIQALLGKIAWSNKVSDYHYVLFDCPPSFTPLSRSVLSVCDLILIPVNPDFYAAKGVRLILDALKSRIEPFPVPKIAVFMNKAKFRGAKMAVESLKYWNQIRGICSDQSKRYDLRVQCLDTPVRDRVGIKRAVTAGGGVPSEFVPDFKALWTGIEDFLT